MTWLKIKCLQRAGSGDRRLHASPTGARVGLGALLVGVHEGAQLALRRQGGHGLLGRGPPRARRAARRLEQRDSPFDARCRVSPRAHWVKPELVGEVAFTEWTSDGRMRHPSFQGLREDKPARDGRARERPPPTALVRRGRLRRGRCASRACIAHAPRPRALSESGVTKRDLARYYEAVADWILPHLADRPTTLVRCPDGVGGDVLLSSATRAPARPRAPLTGVCASQEAGGATPSSSTSLPGADRAGADGHPRDTHLERDDRAARAARPRRCSTSIPARACAGPTMIDAARLLRAHAARPLKLESFVKTTRRQGPPRGGAHHARAGWDEGAAFTRAVATALARSEPGRFTATMAKAAREGRIFIDYLRNRRGATSVAAFSTRATPERARLGAARLGRARARVPADRYTSRACRGGSPGCAPIPGRATGHFARRSPGGTRGPARPPDAFTR